MKNMNEIFTSQELKKHADQHLTFLLGPKDNIFSGEMRHLIICSMASFACEMISESIKELINEK